MITKLPDGSLPQMFGELSRKERHIAEDVAKGDFSVLIRRGGFDILIPYNLAAIYVKSNHPYL